MTPTPDRTSHRRSIPAVLVAATFALAACGGSADDAGGTAQSRPEATEAPVVEVDEPDTAVADSIAGPVETDAGPTDAIDTSPGDGVQLLVAGNVKADAVELPVTYEVGQSTMSLLDLDLALTVDIGAGANETVIGLEMDFTQEVTAVDAGIATVTGSIDRIEVTDAPDEAEQAMAEQFEAILGQQILLQYDDRGNQIGGVTLADGSPLPGDFAGTFDSTTTDIAYPTEKVGVGAVWSATSTIDSGGVTIEAETTYELIEIDPDSIVVASTQDIPVESTSGGIDISGTIQGEGTYTVGRSNPLDVDGDFRQVADLELSGDGQSGSTNSDTTVVITST